jgi:hypothetical protein
LRHGTEASKRQQREHQRISSGGIPHDGNAYDWPEFESKAERRGSSQPVGKPHRITYDCTATRYRQLKLASMNMGDSMNAIISSAIDEWLAAHPEALEM